MANVQVVVFRGVRFRRYPDAERRTERVYFTPGVADRQRGVRRLHEEMYLHHHGPIPDGWHVHHVDGDPLNNAPGNLQALSPRDHIATHYTDERRDAAREHAERIRPAAVAWHGSAEGLAWHAEHGRAVWVDRESVERVCEQCGGRYETRAAQDVRFCSNACKSAWRRASGLDDTQRPCAQCGDDFTVNRYSKQRYCGRVCGGLARRGPRSGVRADGSRAA